MAGLGDADGTVAGRVGSSAAPEAGGAPQLLHSHEQQRGVQDEPAASGDVDDLMAGLEGDLDLENM